MTPIYHITHVKNLSSIIAAGGLWCDRLCSANAPGSVNIAHQHIKARRAQRRVTAGAGGTLADYAPFYFAPRSPMLYTINRGNVEGHTGGQRPIIHLVSSVEAAAELGKPWTFTDGHADMLLTEFYDDLELLPTAVDWNIMKERYWSDTAADNDRSRRRQAEFLVHEFFPWAAFSRVGVHNQEAEQAVRLALSHTTHQPVVTIAPSWYY